MKHLLNVYEILWNRLDIMVVLNWMHDYGFIYSLRLVTCDMIVVMILDLEDGMVVLPMGWNQ